MDEWLSSSEYALHFSTSDRQIHGDYTLNVHREKIQSSDEHLGRRRCRSYNIWYSHLRLTHITICVNRRWCMSIVQSLMDSHPYVVMWALKMTGMKMMDRQTCKAWNCRHRRRHPISRGSKLLPRCGYWGSNQYKMLPQLRRCSLLLSTRFVVIGHYVYEIITASWHNICSWRWKLHALVQVSGLFVPRNIRTTDYSYHVYTIRTMDHSYTITFLTTHIICCHCQLLRRYEVQMLLLQLSCVAL